MEKPRPTLTSQPPHALEKGKNVIVCHDEAQARAVLAAWAETATEPQAPMAPALGPMPKPGKIEIESTWLDSMRRPGVILHRAFLHCGVQVVIAWREYEGYITRNPGIFRCAGWTAEIGGDPYGNNIDEIPVHDLKALEDALLRLEADARVMVERALATRGQAGA